MAVVDLVLHVVKAVVFVFDVVTYPIYHMTQQPWTEKTKQFLGSVSSGRERKVPHLARMPDLTRVGKIPPADCLSLRSRANFSGKNTHEIFRVANYIKQIWQNPGR